jgi:hypothetical protein
MISNSRRRFLMASAAAAVSAPFMRTARAQQSPPRRLKRLVIFYCVNGQAPKTWAPTGSERDFQLSSVLSPLEPFKKDLLVLDGIGIQSAIDDPTAFGHSQIAHVLTSTRSLGVYHPRNLTDSVVGSAGGISVDQFIAKQLGQSTPFPTLQFGVQIGETQTGWQRVSYLGPHQPVQPDEDPFHAFTRIFAGSSGSPEQQAQILTRRHSLIDFAADRVARLRAQLGTRDQQRLAAHVDALRELERGLDAPPGAQCVTTPLGDQLDVKDPANYPQVLKMHMDLAVMALACGRTNVTVIQASSARNFTTTPRWIGINETAHDLQHHYHDSPDVLKQFLALQQWYASQFAYLVGRLAAIDEGDGTTMLDNTAVLWADSLGEPSNHTSGPVPFVLAGGKTFFRTGRYVKLSGPGRCGGFESHGRLLVSLCQACGVETDKFGDPAFCKGGALSELV